jgi:hypothetical protein
MEALSMEHKVCHLLMEDEEIRSIEGFPQYAASSLGRVISFHSGAPRILAPRPHAAGYKIITLANNGQQKTTTVHRLIATVFLPNPRGLPVVRHLDGDKARNGVANLAWGTYSENEADKIGHGTRRYGTGRMKLNGEARAKVFALAQEGRSRYEIAAYFQVHYSTITRLLNGSTWANRKWPMAANAGETQR